MSKEGASHKSTEKVKNYYTFLPLVFGKSNTLCCLFRVDDSPSLVSRPRIRNTKGRYCQTASENNFYQPRKLIEAKHCDCYRLPKRTSDTQRRRVSPQFKQRVLDQQTPLRKVPGHVSVNCCAEWRNQQEWQDRGVGRLSETSRTDSGFVECVCHAMWCDGNACWQIEESPSCFDGGVDFEYHRGHSAHTMQVG